MTEESGEVSDPFTLGVLVKPTEPSGELSDDESQGEGLSGYNEAVGWRGRHVKGGPAVAELGEQIVRAAAHAVASQVAVFADQVASTLDRQRPHDPSDDQLSLDTVELSFGITLTAGAGPAISALIDVQGESTFEVTVTLSRRKG